MIYERYLVDWNVLLAYKWLKSGRMIEIFKCLSFYWWKLCKNARQTFEFETHHRPNLQSIDIQLPSVSINSSMFFLQIFFSFYIENKFHYLEQHNYLQFIVEISEKSYQSVVVSSNTENDWANCMQLVTVRQ